MPLDDVPAFCVLLKSRAQLYLDTKRLLEAAFSLLQAAQPLEERVRAWEEISESEIRDFVDEHAKAFIRAGVLAGDYDATLEVLIEEAGYDAVIRLLKDYAPKDPTEVRVKQEEAQELITKV